MLRVMARGKGGVAAVAVGAMAAVRAVPPVPVGGCGGGGHGKGFEPSRPHSTGTSSTSRRRTRTALPCKSDNRPADHHRTRTASTRGSTRGSSSGGGRRSSSTIVPVTTLFPHVVLKGAGFDPSFVCRGQLSELFVPSERACLLLPLLGPGRGLSLHREHSVLVKARGVELDVKLVVHAVALLDSLVNLLVIHHHAVVNLYNFPSFLDAFSIGLRPRERLGNTALEVMEADDPRIKLNQQPMISMFRVLFLGADLTGRETHNRDKKPQHA
mmetsp:Transcript_3138/g.6093  ORF Transcript_3138/g.6093 Transcript_3138/m.6093 type:complete len:270 (+) Transcript_3138:214-1023(+)